MLFGILGPVEIITDSGPVSAAQPRHRAFLAYLLLHANRVVTPDQVIEAIWGGAEPASARTQVHVAISGLRKALRERGLDDVVVTCPGGYRLELAYGALDADVFAGRVKAGRRLLERGAHEEAARELDAAAGLWRGQALADITAAYADAARHRLHEQRLSALESLADARLALGDHDALIPKLSGLVEAHPLREPMVCRLMLAQYRAGLRSQALETARRMRGLLAEEEGLDPGEAFVRLEQAILTADQSLSLAPATWVRPAQLPYDVHRFTGRVRELETLTAMACAADPPPAVLVVGTAGVGKSALAVHWAHGHRDRFPDGQLYVNLRGFDPGRDPLEPLEVLHRFLRSVGVDAVPDEVDEAAALLRSRLSRQRVLILLDNARDAEQIRPLLPGSASCVVLVTSRNQLRGLIANEGARLLRLDPLTAIEADELLRGAITSSTADDAQAIRELARRCAYLPLALRLAAAQLICRPHLTIVEYTRRLSTDDALEVLDIQGGLKGPVDSAFELSYRALGDVARRLFRLLSLAPGQDFAPEAAAALLGVALAGARRPLEELSTAHMIDEHRAGRYTMHDLLRSYAIRMLASDEPDEGRTEAALRLVDFYADAVFAAYPLLQPRRPPGERQLTHPPVERLRFADRAEALAWHDAERESFVGVVELAARHGRHHRAWRLTSDLLAYFIIRRRWREWSAALRIGHASATRCGDLEGMTYMSNSSGIVCKQTGRYAEAVEHYLRAIDLATAAGSDRMVGSAHANLGGLYITQGRPEEGMRHLRIALAVPEYGQVPQYAAAGHVNLGCALIELGSLPEADEALRRALGYAIACDDVQQICFSLHNLTEIALRRGDREAARRHAETQLTHAEELGDPLRTAAALDLLASTVLLEDLPAARAHWRAALAIYRDLGHRQSAVLSEWLATIEEDLDDLARANEEYRRRCRRLV
ncbi:BTAD domain-containing putative transcriptional regulator [Nonomuraea sp. NPDC050478]|uniref:AfsR/SARP family transcriptional regulator n=1 Tax=Nonomuraea sp. NPDC050478 TaxID=3364365 RepID=UPI00379FF378